MLCHGRPRLKRLTRITNYCALASLSLTISPDNALWPDKPLQTQRPGAVAYTGSVQGRL